MSQNQSYFWQTTRHNVYLKRSAKLQMLIAMLAVLTFATICAAEVGPRYGDDGMLQANSAPAAAAADGEQQEINKRNNHMFNGGNELPQTDATKETNTKTGFVDAFTASISVILFTELGDKTFFIAAIMAMRHPRLIVFSGAISALALMTILSVVFGMAATLIPKVYTYYISTALFAIFGLKMIYEGYTMKDTDAQEELEEVQSDLRKREDELMRSTRGLFDDGDAKRKNSNSDKEDDDGNDADVGNATGATMATSTKNPEMQHRQRKQHHSSKLNKHLNHNNNNNTGCELNKDNDIDEFHETDSFLLNEHTVPMPNPMPMTMTMAANFHSSPTISASALSTQTEQTHCDNSNELSSTKMNDVPAHVIRSQRHNSMASNNKMNGDTNATAMVHSTSASAVMMAKNGNMIASKGNSINSLSNLSLNSVAAAGQPKEELTMTMQTGGGTKKRLERDVSSTIVQDPESGIIRKTPKKSATYLTTRVLMQAFTMTFLAEWGDRSQLTTIILAASKNVYGVITGGIIGHSICTGLAVIGGRMVAAKISLRTVTIVGGVVFIGFAFYALIAPPDDI